MVMKASLWAKIRRLHEIQRWSNAAIARQLGCCHKTVRKALAMDQPPSQTGHAPRTSKLERYKPRIDQLIAQYPNLSAVRVLEEISKGDDGYQGGITLVRDYLRAIRPARVLSPGVPRTVRALLTGALRLRPPRSRIERDGGDGCAVRQAERTGRP